MVECSTWIYCMDEEGIVGKLCRDNEVECAVRRYVYRPDLYLIGGASLVCSGVLHFITVPFIMVALKKLDPRIKLPPPLSYCVRANVDA
ncbi:unnamed protein product [Orchesella dallaii]|uniref:Uncharacterized protein n=1 Tax=Orchesella dallaii TaxID=48710 RepID=A0ABP1QY36_9HEXA